MRNDRGAVQLRPGEAIAVAGRDRPMPQPRQLPPAVTAQALRHIATQVGPPPAPRAFPALPATEAQADAAANAVPAADQASQQATPPGDTPPAAADPAAAAARE